LKRPLLAFDEQQALAGEHEEVLLVALGAVHPARLSGLDHLQGESEIGELLHR
jgi:hypothetical protein